MAGAFDDLIPSQPAQQPQGFDDLIPQGDPSQWGPVSEAANSAMLGSLPLVKAAVKDAASGGGQGNFLSLTGPGWQPNPSEVQQNQSDRDAYASQNPGTALAADVAGGSLPFLATGGATSGLGLGARALAMAGTGAAAGGVPAAVKGDDASSILGNALVGVGLGGAGEVGGTALTGAGGKLADAIANRNVVVPAAADIKSAANAGYDAMRGSTAATFTLPAISDMAQDTIDAMGNKGMHSGAPGTLQILNKLANPPPGAVGVTTGGLEEARQSLTALAKQNPSSTEAAAASLAKSNLDNFANYPPTGSVASGSVAPYLSQAADARGNWAAQARSGTLTGALDRSKGTAEAGNGDLASKLAQRSNAILNSPRLSQGLTADDQANLAAIRAGTPLSSIGRAASKGEGTTLWGGMLGAYEGHAAGGIPGAIAGGIGPYAAAKLAQAGSGYFAKNAMNAADEATRMNSPLFRQMVSSGQSAAPVNVGPATDQARRLAAAMMASGSQATVAGETQP